MAAITVNVERRAVCEQCGSIFESQAISAHRVAGKVRCPAIPKGARRPVIVFRLLDNGEELGVVEVGGTVPADLS